MPVLPWYIWALGFTIAGVYLWAIIKSAIDATKVDNHEYWW